MNRTGDQGQESTPGPAAPHEDRRFPLIFLGVAEHLEQGAPPPPIGPTTLFRLSKVKTLLFYPCTITTFRWMFLFDADSAKGGTALEIELRNSKSGKTFGNMRFQSEQPQERNGETHLPISRPEPIPQEYLYASVPQNPWTMVAASLEAAVEAPCTLEVVATCGERTQIIGTVHFLYKPRAPFAQDEMRAIEADPHATKHVRYEIGCTKCQSQFRVYSGLQRTPALEAEGYVWQHDVPASFACGCGSTVLNLRYIRESLHALIGRDARVMEQGLSFARRYGHEELIKTLDAFSNLVAQESNETPIQEFIEKHPVLLARFHAKRLLVKPDIIGKFQADFAALDTRGVLWLIELEKPSLKLFKDAKPNVGHALSSLEHAFNQVSDWLFEVSRHRQAVLEKLGFKDDDVVDVRCVVIAGRTKPEDREAVSKKLLTMNNKIDFLTLDDLAASVYRISRDLA